MDTNNTYYVANFNDSSFELPQHPTVPSTPCLLPDKPCKESKQLLIDKLCIRGPRYFDDVPGSINFNFLICRGRAPSLCVYSKTFQKVYVTMNHKLRIKFFWNSTMKPLFLRSAIIYAEEMHKMEPIQRCYAHLAPELPQNIGIEYDQMRHVFRVYDPVNAYESTYGTDRNGILNTRTMLKAESAEASIDYQFFCQNSCPTGINKRPTKMLFLIEDSMGVVLAKRSMLIQICSNPKRDMHREEYRLTPPKMIKRRVKKQPQHQLPLPPLPPVNYPDSTCNADENVYSLSIDVVGEENYRAVVKYAYDVMATQAICTGNHQHLKPHMDAILHKEKLTDC